MRQVVAGLGLPDQTRHNWMRAEDKTKLKSLPTVPVRPSRSIISRLTFSQEGSARTAYAARAPEHPIKRRASILLLGRHSCTAEQSLLLWSLILSSGIEHWSS
jgi:hypothetical protein